MQVENKVLSSTRRKMGKPEIERMGIEETRPYQGHSLIRASSALLCPRDLDWQPDRWTAHGKVSAMRYET